MTNSKHSDDRSWSVVIPFFNEQDFLPATLESLKRQTLSNFELILVDNGSSDQSVARAKSVMSDAAHIKTVFLTEREPGQVHALEAGINHVSTPFTAICDADTIYPPFYLERAHAMFRRSPEGVVGVMAASVYGDPSSLSGRLQRLKCVAVAAVLRRQLHTGGYAHLFRTDVLKRSGGYSKSRWPYVLKDHELVHRMMKFGRTKYAFDLWCQPSDRRADRKNVRWTLSERLIYHFTPYVMKDWFFYSFLSRRFQARRMNELKLRERSWDTEQN